MTVAEVRAEDPVTARHSTLADLPAVDRKVSSEAPQPPMALTAVPPAAEWEAAMSAFGDSFRVTIRPAQTEDPTTALHVALADVPEVGWDLFPEVPALPLRPPLPPSPSAPIAATPDPGVEFNAAVTGVFAAAPRPEALVAERPAPVVEPPVEPSAVPLAAPSSLPPPGQDQAYRRILSELRRAVLSRKGRS